MSGRIEIDIEEMRRLRVKKVSWPEIADRLGCSLRTVKRRAKEAGLVEADEATRRNAERATRAAAARWALRRADEADRAGAMASKILLQIQELLPFTVTGLVDSDNKGEMILPAGAASLSVLRLVRSYSELVKNAQLLSGGATDRPERPEAARDAEWATLIEELELRVVEEAEAATRAATEAVNGSQDVEENISGPEGSDVAD